MNELNPMNHRYVGSYTNGGGLYSTVCGNDSLAEIYVIFIGYFSPNIAVVTVPVWRTHEVSDLGNLACQSTHLASLSQKDMLVTIALLDMSESTRVTDKEQATITGRYRKAHMESRGRGILLYNDTLQEKQQKVADELIERVRGRRDQNYEHS